MSPKPSEITHSSTLLGKKNNLIKRIYPHAISWIILRANPLRHMADESRRSTYCLALFLMSGHAVPKGSVSGYQQTGGQIIRVSEHQIASQTDYADVNTDYSDG